MTLMETSKRALVLVGSADALLMPATASAHPIQPAVAAQPVSWVVLVMLTALGAFAFIVCAATVWRLSMHRRRQVPAPRTEMVLTSALAGCAVLALVAFVATQLQF